MATQAQEVAAEVGSGFTPPACGAPPPVNPALLTTAYLPDFTFPGVIPNTGYRCSFTWDAVAQGSFAPYAYFDGLTNTRNAEFNRNSADCSPVRQSWSVTVPPASGGGYTPTPLAIAGAALIGVWTRGANGPAVTNGVVTIAGNWTIQAL